MSHVQELYRQEAFGLISSRETVKIVKTEN